MTPFESQFADLSARYPTAVHNALPSGAQLVEIPNFPLPLGWSRPDATLIFVAPAGFPAAQPDCFWVEVEPGPFRLANSGTPKNTNDSNLVPEFGKPRGTWFSWHMSSWDPNRDSLLRYVSVVLRRLKDPS